MPALYLYKADSSLISDSIYPKQSILSTYILGKYSFWKIYCLWCPGHIKYVDKVTSFIEHNGDHLIFVEKMFQPKPGTYHQKPSYQFKYTFLSVQIPKCG